METKEIDIKTSLSFSPPTRGWGRWNFKEFPLSPSPSPSRERGAKPLESVAP